MIINEENTKTIIKNMRAEGDQSRADYMEMLADENRQLEARIARAEWAANVFLDAKPYNTELVQKAARALNETPQQSTAEVQADVLEQAVDNLETVAVTVNWADSPIQVLAVTVEDLLGYADQLRQKTEVK